MVFRRARRRWGYYKVFLEGKGFWVKKLTFEGGYTHFQTHKNRDELWLIYVPRGVKHQIGGRGSIYEIAFGEPDEKDVKYYKEPDKGL